MSLNFGLDQVYLLDRFLLNLVLIWVTPTIINYRVRSHGAYDFSVGLGKCFCFALFGHKLLFQFLQHFKLCGNLHNLFSIPSFSPSFLFLGQVNLTLELMLVVGIESLE
jgi:hypothetical protein